MIMLENFITSIEKRVYGPDAFRLHAAATRTLLKFCTEHQCNDPALEHVRACLANLEAGVRSKAIEAYKKVTWGKEGFSDWWPHPTPPLETQEYVGEVFLALAERWHRLMESFLRRPA
jgi:hypothetical protein